ncbi:MAG: hypothetical protein RSA24_06280, partial [Clostridia bacterium]
MIKYELYDIDTPVQYDIKYVLRKERKPMKSGTIDKRIIKTKQAMRSAFIELVQEKNMSELSISGLTKVANITRSTFYMYYQSIGDVRDEIENEMIKSLEKFLLNNNIRQVLENPYPFLRALSDKIMSYDEMNHYLVCGKDSGGLLDKIKSIAVDAFMDSVPEQEQDLRTTVRYIATFLTAGILDSYKEWFHHQDSISLEDLCKNFSEIILINAEHANQQIDANKQACALAEVAKAKAEAEAEATQPEATQAEAT